MGKKIKLKPGYDPDKYRDKLCEIFNKNQGSMTLREYMIARSEKLRKSPLLRKFDFVTDVPPLPDSFFDPLPDEELDLWE